MSQNAYEIRHAILNEAREMLFAVWYRDHETVSRNADRQDRVTKPEEMPPAPTFEAILDLAKKMNDFVSEK